MKNTYQEILLPSLGNASDYVAHTCREYVDLDGENIAELANLGEKKLPYQNNQINQTVKIYGRKSEFAYVSIVRIYECKIDK